MAAPRGLYLFVTYCCRQDGGTTWSVFVCHILLKARWRRHVVCICLSHIVVGKMAAPLGLYLLHIVASKMTAQSDPCVQLYKNVHVKYCIRALIILDNNNIYVSWMIYLYIYSILFCILF
jgi:hypothetical protein